MVFSALNDTKFEYTYKNLYLKDIKSQTLMTGSLTFVSCHSWFQLALFQYDIIFIKGRYGLLKYAYKKGGYKGLVEKE